MNDDRWRQRDPLGTAVRRTGAAWVETWEGRLVGGTPVYAHVLDRAEIGAGTRVLDCGCGAGRFARMADRGAGVAGIDRRQS
jgi:2-polyprenyl-3-methyl-5-hydroxy-6-metoxy-1,4-benzoquinol methylase